MASNTPGSGTPDPDSAPVPDPAAAPVGEWPSELVPPEEPPPAVVPEPAAELPPAADPEPGTETEVFPVSAAPTEAVAAPVVATTAPPPAAQPQWGAPPPAQPPAQPPASGGWGAPVPPPPQAGGAWGSPPPGQYGGGVPPAAAGSGEPASWAPQPAKSNHGCLKACLVVGAICVVVSILFFVALAALGMKFASDFGVNPDGSMEGCELIASQDLGAILGSEPEVLPMRGLADATIGQVLDKRVLADAPDCWLIAGDASGITGRLARQESGDASSAYRSARGDAESGGYLAGDMDGIGDEAFCTGVSDAMSVGVLVRSGGRLAFVSLIDGSGLGGNLETTETGVMTSVATCELAGQIALEMLR